MDLNDDGNQWTGCVNAEDLDTMDAGTHFSAEGLRTLGQRYGTKYLAMTNSTIAPKSGTINIMAVGDSITQGYDPSGAFTPSYRQEFEGLLAEAGCDYQMVGSRNSNYPSRFSGKHEGYSGHRADHMLTGYSSNPGITAMMNSTSYPTPDAVLLHIGSNDSNWGQSATSTFNEIQDIIEKIHTPNRLHVKIFIADLIPWYADPTVNSKINNRRNKIKNAYDPPGVNNIILVPVSNLNDTGMMQLDMIHPNSIGEAHITDAFAAKYESEFTCDGPAVDLFAPDEFITTPSNNATIPGTLNYTGTATDRGGSGFQKVRIAIRNTDTQEWFHIKNESFQAGVYIKNAVLLPLSQRTAYNTDWSTDVNNLPTGNYKLFALTIDNEGNNDYDDGIRIDSLWLVTQSFSVDLADTTPPTVSIDQLPATASGDVTIEGSSSDNLAIDINRLLVVRLATG